MDWKTKEREMKRGRGGSREMTRTPSSIPLPTKPPPHILLRTLPLFPWDYTPRSTPLDFYLRRCIGSGEGKGGRRGLVGIIFTLMMVLFILTFFLAHTVFPYPSAYTVSIHHSSSSCSSSCSNSSSSSSCLRTNKKRLSKELE